MTRTNSISKFNKGKEASIFTTKDDNNTASILAVEDVMVYNAQLTGQYDVTTAAYNFDNNLRIYFKYFLV